MAVASVPVVGTLSAAVSDLVVGTLSAAALYLILSKLSTTASSPVGDASLSTAVTSYSVTVYVELAVVRADY